MHSLYRLPLVSAFALALGLAACTTGSDGGPAGSADTDAFVGVDAPGIEIGTQDDGVAKPDAPAADVAQPDDSVPTPDGAGDAPAPDAAEPDAAGPADTAGDSGLPDLGPAIQACQGKQEGDPCTLQFTDQTVDGACVLFNGALLCSMTSDPGPQTEHEAAVQACQGKNGGDACSFAFEGDTTNGHCQAQQGEVVCVPQQGGGGSDWIPQEAIDACQGLAADAPCAFQYQGQDVDGNCTDVQGQLVCAPGGSGSGGGSWIPQEAVDACAGQPDGTPCSATAYGQSYDGACGDVLGTFACAPDWLGGGSGGNPEPGPCDGKAEGDACTATVLGQTYDGTCKTVLGTMNCAPDWMPGG